MAETTRLKVKHQIGHYEIMVGQGLLPGMIEHLHEVEAIGPIGIVTNSTVNDIYGDSLREGLKTAGLVTRTILIPDGEKFKTLASVEQVISALITQGMERSGTIITLGGGVTTDLGGFVASILFRGIKLIHVPTTLLAMVDASVGGKTGVNHVSGKNLIGSFYQPDLVVMDVETLKTLDPRDRISGYAEMLKMGAIRDLNYLKRLTDQWGNPAKLPSNDVLTRMLTRSCELKAEVVEADEKEADLRRILNFGHTIGHAIETSIGYGEIRHGEAVILGMYAAGWLSNQVGSLSAGEWQQLAEMLLKIPIPISIEALDPGAIEQATRLDKKVANSQLHFVLLQRLGKAEMKSGIPAVMIKMSIEALKIAWSKV